MGGPPGTGGSVAEFVEAVVQMQGDLANSLTAILKSFIFLGVFVFKLQTD